MTVIDQISQTMEQPAVFQETSFENGRTIREAINDRQRGLDDLLRLLEKAEKFKQWLDSLPDDANLLREYINSIVRLNWLDNLPTKAFRFLVANIVGIKYPLAGLAISTADAFLVDEIVKGWQPSMFVEDTLHEFVHDRRS